MLNRIREDERDGSTPHRAILSIAAVILAAGGSSRFGRPKQLAMFEGETLLARTIRLAHEAGASPIYVVLGADRERIGRTVALDSVIVLENPEWEQGISSSLHVMANALMAAQISHALVMLCDQPAVTAAHLSALAALAQREPMRTAASFYAGHAGVPAVLPSQAFPQLLSLRGDSGARSLLKDAATIPLQFGEADCDTPLQLEEWQKKGAADESRHS